MPQTTIGRGNVVYDWLISPTITWSAATVGATTTAELTATIPGLQVGDYVDLYVQNAAMTTGLAITNVRVSAANTLAVTWVNTTAGGLTVQTGPWLMNIVRPESVANLVGTAS